MDASADIFDFWKCQPETNWDVYLQAAVYCLSGTWRCTFKNHIINWNIINFLTMLSVKLEKSKRMKHDSANALFANPGYNIRGFLDI